MNREQPDDLPPTTLMQVGDYSVAVGTAIEFGTTLQDADYRVVVLHDGADSDGEETVAELFTDTIKVDELAVTTDWTRGDSETQATVDTDRTDLIDAVQIKPSDVYTVIVRGDHIEIVPSGGVRLNSSTRGTRGYGGP